MSELQQFPYSRVCVFGAARSGVGAMSLLRHHEVQVTLVDERAAMEFRSLIRRLRRQYVTYYFGRPVNKSDALRNCEAIIVSPGIPLTHSLIEEAMDRGIDVISEVELASYFAKAPITAITGTNGKTTTTTLVGQMVTDSGVNAVVAGNIGRAFSDAVLSSEDVSRRTELITEVSSFQLESIEDFSPHIAVILNIARDHMDRYPSMADYIDAKFQITKNQGPDDFLILNEDDPMTMKAAEDSEAQIYTFSMEKEVEQGAYVCDGKIYLKEDGEAVCFCDLSDVPIPGTHNVQNCLASLVISRRIGISQASLKKTLGRFKGVEHRIEFVARRDDCVEYYNDSKATNVDSLEKALLSFDKPIVLVAGGRDKQSAYERLNSLVKERVKQVILIGEAAPLMEKAWGGIVPVETAKSMEEAVKNAGKAAVEGNVVLLSPACASFDMFKDYEERGAVYKRCVRAELGL